MTKCYLDIAKVLKIRGILEPTQPEISELNSALEGKIKASSIFSKKDFESHNLTT